MKDKKKSLNTREAELISQKQNSKPATIKPGLPRDSDSKKTPPSNPNKTSSAGKWLNADHRRYFTEPDKVPNLLDTLERRLDFGDFEALIPSCDQ